MLASICFWFTSDNSKTVLWTNQLTVSEAVYGEPSPLDAVNPELLKELDAKLD